MPANLTPDYKKAEAAYKRARDPQERLELLREMHRTIPKHKGTEHLRADIKTKIKELNDELAGPAKGGARSGPPTFIHGDGAAQVAIKLFLCAARTKGRLKNNFSTPDPCPVLPEPYILSPASYFLTPDT